MSRRVLTQVVAQPRRSRNHLQAQVKLLRRIRKQLNQSSSVSFNEENDNQASAVAPKALLKTSPSRNYRWWTSGWIYNTSFSSWRSWRWSRCMDSNFWNIDTWWGNTCYAAPDKDSGAVSTLLPEMLIGINMKFYLMEIGIALSKMGNVLYFIFRCRTLIKN